MSPTHSASRGKKSTHFPNRHQLDAPRCRQRILSRGEKKHTFLITRFYHPKDGRVSTWGVANTFCLAGEKNAHASSQDSIIPRMVEITLAHNWSHFESWISKIAESNFLRAIHHFSRLNQGFPTTYSSIRRLFLHTSHSPLHTLLPTHSASRGKILTVPPCSLIYHDTASLSDNVNSWVIEEDILLTIEGICLCFWPTFWRNSLQKNHLDAPRCRQRILPRGEKKHALLQQTSTWRPPVSPTHSVSRGKTRTHFFTRHYHPLMPPGVADTFCLKTHMPHHKILSTHGW